MDPNIKNVDNSSRVTLNNILGIEDNDSLLANGGGGECEDSDRSFIGGPDPYLDNEDEGLNLMCVEKEVNIHNQREVDEEDHMPYQDEYEDHVTDEDENGEGINEETFTHEQFIQGDANAVNNNGGNRVGKSNHRSTRGGGVGGGRSGSRNNRSSESGDVETDQPVVQG
ncbi:hypothetical protein K7X08_025152 [Anisodus acutangulus]|uniref:Uncharacterized protein n=1 Tax=Anisodus acutangulus TaxID=402998 RepID=A0A9Q1MC92_9SOLA|nr:hypothetical protein K7X08_025152 [Anisodus acutangulus]